MTNGYFLTAADFTCLFSAILSFQSVLYFSLKGSNDCLAVVVQNVLEVALYQHLCSCSHVRTKVKTLNINRTFCGYSTQLSPTYNFRELDRKWVSVLQQKKQQKALLQWGKTSFSLFTLMVLQFLYCVDGAAPVHKICTKPVKNKRIKKRPVMIFT